MRALEEDPNVEEPLACALRASGYPGFADRCFVVVVLGDEFAISAFSWV